ncbi:MAG: RagB/SusD family nutrient uptake outer membrane protein [Bacteroidetes bacterium]|nr:MAG: RagB/SusD family nutrient uptake outer membrane protein [Bacteroidota bacterium]
MKFTLSYKIITLATLLLFGCKQIDNVVDIQPTMLLTEDTALTSLNAYDALLLSSYGQLRTVHFTSIYVSDFLADDVKVGGNSPGQGAPTYYYQHNSATAEFSTIWTAGYAAINLANIIIKRLPDFQADAGVKSRILGEAYAIRAMAHFDLLKYYAPFYNGSNGGELGIPYITEPAVALQKPSRNTIDVCYANIDSDLNQASALLSAGTPRVLTGTNIPQHYFRPIIINALKARIALYRQNWNEAITQATTVINASSPMVTGTPYRTMFTSAENLGEIIFKLRFEQGQGRLGNNYWGEASDLCYFVTSTDLTGLYLAGEDRLAAFTQVTPQATATLPGGGLAIVKNRGGVADYGRVDLKIFRATEMYSIRAEANARLNQITAAHTDHNAIRTARGVPSENLLPMTQQQAIIRILAEKRREFAFEGHRLLELRRAGQGIRRLNHNVTGIAGDFTNDTNFFRVFPIPLTETQPNPNVTQNPGY